jgi:hypothetical protein
MHGTAEVKADMVVTSRRDVAIQEALIRWFVLVVLIGVLPIGFNGVSAITMGDTISWKVLLSHGELMIVSVAISAAAGGELFTVEGQHFRRLKALLGGAEFVLVCGASMWYAVIASAVRDNGPENLSFVAWGSLVVFLGAILTGGCSVAISKVQR